jgi:hypothetical protein
MSKFRFWMSYTNRNGKSYGAGLGEGYGVHTRGWNAGVKVTPRTVDRVGNADHDAFDVYLTSGSHETAHDVRLGRVVDTKDGPVWTPDMPGDVLLASVNHVAAAE